MPSTVELVQALVNGVGIGLVYGLIAIGFCVIYNASGIVNFAQGVFVMLGGMFTHAMLIKLGWPLWFPPSSASFSSPASGCWCRF